MDEDGALYGTTRVGGVGDAGTVFRMTPKNNQKTQWKFTLLHEFNTSNGREPHGDLILGPDGSLYGTTTTGGLFGQGTVFKLSPPTSGRIPWTQTVLHSFQGGENDGAQPYGGVIRGDDGVLFGTTIAGGVSGLGTVYALSPPASSGGVWKLRLLTTFVGNRDGSTPFGAVAMNAGGDIFGATTRGGGTCDCGTLYMLSPPAGDAADFARAKWRKTILYRFTGQPDGSNPYSQLLLGEGGVFYGTTFLGGDLDYGSVFSLTPPTDSSPWKLKLLASFKQSGRGPLFYGALARDDSGSLYGTTQSSRVGFGTVFKLMPPSEGPSWSFKNLHQFDNEGEDGLTPNAAVILDAKGRVFGTTVLGGGETSNGTVFMVTP